MKPGNYRRRLLQAAMGLPLCAWQAAGAQKDDRTLQVAPRPDGAAPAASSAPLLAAPRRALVVGNSAYAIGPLRNPANDAKAIAEALKSQGFDVTLGLDLKRTEMLQLIGAYGQALARQKPVALFYFAGHGLQLAWRNYLVPVDASIRNPKDIQTQCVDVNAVIEGMAKAANPMNMVILDACRNDPFGRSEQKGLSQLDAPPATLLAYATSPGHVASDGEGVNGLYTEHLLREMQVPEVKIEDVFKRVRLGVRKRSNGRQIPWESTSLEQDFWFLPPKGLKRLADEEAERLFAEELALWEKADGAPQAGLLEDYLRRYPSGRFAELAQLQLDTLLARLGEQRIQIASSEGNPFSQGSARADVDYKVGDSYTYVRLNRETRAKVGRAHSRVTEVTDTQVIFNDGALVYDRLGNAVKLPDGRTFTARQDLPLEYAVGKKWSTRFIVRDEARRKEAETEFEFRITRREQVTVPAGTFDCFVIEGDGWSYTGRGARVRLGFKRWMAPGKVRRPVILEQFREIDRSSSRGRGGNSQLNNDRQELVAFSQS